MIIKNFELTIKIFILIINKINILNKNIFYKYIFKIKYF